VSDDKCPFCGEPASRSFGASIQRRFRCGTQGPDINGEYDIGHTCDITVWTRLFKEKEKRIAELEEALLLIRGSALADGTADELRTIAAKALGGEA
jgi:hypothetical protein